MKPVQQEKKLICDDCCVAILETGNSVLRAPCHRVMPAIVPHLKHHPMKIVAIWKPDGVAVLGVTVSVLPEDLVAT